MNWLAQNGFWVIAAIAVTWLVLRGGLARGARGHGPEHGASAPGLNGNGLLNSVGHHGGLLGGILGGIGHGGHGGHSEDRAESGQPNDRATNVPEAALDPVSGEPVSTARALTSVYQDKIYFFASKENRDRFEAAPQDYAQKAAGRPVQPYDAPIERPRRSHGC